MDRRTILAIVLATLSLVIYQVVFAPSEQPVEQPTEQVQTEAPAAEPPSPTRTEEPSAPPQLAPAEVHATQEGIGVANVLRPETAPLVPIEFPGSLYTATIDPAGGVVSGWTLADYTDFAEKPADLVADPHEGLFQLALLTNGGRIELHDIPFVSERTQVDGQDRVTLRAQDPSGWSLQLAYTFTPDRYSARVDLEATGLPRGSDLEIIFPEGLPRLEKAAKTDLDAGASLALIGNDLTKHRGVKKEGWSATESGPLRWVGARSKYFLAAAVFDPGTEGTYEAASHRSGATTHVRTTARIPMKEPGEGPISFVLYAGPLELNRLETYHAGLEQAVDLGWKPIVPFSRLLLACLNFLYSVIPNYGLAILILSVVTKVAFYPLTRKSLVSMRAMQKLKPEIDRINELHKDDPQRKQQAMMEMYKTHKINPLGGCLPMLIQMPVFIALYQVLANSVELRKEPFVLWINDLSSPDLIGTVMGIPIHILPLLMAATMVWQQRLQPMDPRQAIIGYMMPIMMLVFFYMLPSGLVFYWTINNVLQVGQQIIVNRESGQQLAAA